MREGGWGAGQRVVQGHPAHGPHLERETRVTAHCQLPPTGHTACLLSRVRVRVRKVRVRVRARVRARKVRGCACG